MRVWAASDTAASRPDGLTPLPRRVPQTSLAVELREEAPATCPEEDAEEFTADHAASSLAGFQRGTLRARDEDGLLDTPRDALAGPAPEDVTTADTNGRPGAVEAPSVTARTPDPDRS
ncbi:hypothetical protein [Streptomyces pseudovenezuelae]|uniref:hypothetical protein n=1 Tax=Streptomyces pseudovenezuelae TaxID=67350 RepID=UPI003F61E685